MARTVKEDLEIKYTEQVKKDAKEKKYVSVKRLADGRLMW